MNENDKHTSEPWSVATPLTDVNNESETLVQIAGPEGWLGVAHAFGDTPEEAMANAIRIVACVNYCTGMTIRDLKIGQENT